MGCYTRPETDRSASRALLRRPSQTSREAPPAERMAARDRDRLTEQLEAYAALEQRLGDRPNRRPASFTPAGRRRQLGIIAVHHQLDRS